MNNQIKRAILLIICALSETLIVYPASEYLSELTHSFIISALFCFLMVIISFEAFAKLVEYGDE